ncbi:MAG TPA: MFS transporter [Pseudonocardiaceae bacterium]|jgi:MFS family permease|nr:MFS transporter [Pseudonocardiaceae bacterium]
MSASPITESAELQTPAGRPPRHWLPVGLAMFCCGWGGNQFTPLLLMYRRIGGYSEVTVDAFLGAYVVGLVPGLLVAGSLSDRFGRKPLMIAGTICSLLASAVLAAGQLGPAPIFAGRFLTGIAVGIAMAVGTSWVKELSQPPFDLAADRGSGARRAALTLTLGFGLGAGVAGVLAQWLPLPMILPYAVHVLIVLPAVFVLLRVPETRAGRPSARGLLADLRVPAVAHRRFLRVILPMAPWVFGAAGVAYAVAPQLVSAQLGADGLIYATVLTVLTLGAGVLVQPLARRLDSTSTARAIIIAMTLMAVGLVLSTTNAAVRSPWLGLVGAIVLGGAYGIAVVSGLLEIQRIARPDDLAGLTGVYYALCYLGFLLPTGLAALAPLASYTVMLGVVTVLALGCLGAIMLASRAHLPATTRS